MQMKSVALVLTTLMCGAAIAGFAAPDKKLPPPELEKVVPEVFGVWREVKAAGPVVNPQAGDLSSKIYIEQLSRTYVNQSGDRIMLSMAWGDDQRGERQAHRPEICYPAQGFKVDKLSDGTLPTSFGDIDVRRFTASGPRDEPVTYLLAMAGSVVRNDYDKRMVQLRLLRSRHIPDGLLFRVSSVDRDAEQAFKVQQQFAADFIAAVPTALRQRLSVSKPAGTS